MMIDFNVFESLEEEKPSALLDQHPDGEYLAMQVATPDVFLAAIWSNETKKRVWSPEDAYGLAWLRHGTQLAALQNPEFSEEFFFTTYSWPQGQPLQQCPLRFPFGYLFDLIVSPTSDFAICQWTDQCEFGFEFIDLRDDVIHLKKHGYFNRKTNLSTRPVFHPNGHFWVCAYQDNTSWWADENSNEFGLKSAKEGKQEKLGALLVFHQIQLLGEIPLIVTVPANYHPPSIMTSASEYNAYLSNPIFVDNEHVTIHLPSGESPIHELSDFFK